MLKVGIVIADSNSACPVPAVKGGAVATLVEHIVAENNRNPQCRLEVISYYDKKAEALSRQYENVDFHWVKVPRLVNWMDSVVFFLITHLFKKKKAISFKHIFSLIYYIFAAARYLKKSDFDRLVLENNMMLTWVFKLFGNAQRYAGRYYYHLHNIPRIHARRKDVLDGVKAYLCVSEYVGRVIATAENPIGPVPGDKIRVVKNCIDTQKYAGPADEAEKLGAFREKFGIGPQDRVLVFAGRLSKEKGVDRVIEALGSIQTPNVKLLIVGATLTTGQVKDAFSQRLERLAGQYRDRIIFTGYIDQQDMPLVYRLADIALLPSMWEEPAGLTMVEAMACGIPVITTRSGGIPEYTAPGASVLLERDENIAEALARQADALLADEALRRSIGDTGRRHILENYRLDQYLSRFVSALTQ